MKHAYEMWSDSTPVNDLTRFTGDKPEITEEKDRFFTERIQLHVKIKQKKSCKIFVLIL
jgi:hypothetical protein